MDSWSVPEQGESALLQGVVPGRDHAAMDSPALRSRDRTSMALRIAGGRGGLSWRRSQK